MGLAIVLLDYIYPERNTVSTHEQNWHYTYLFAALILSQASLQVQASVMLCISSTVSVSLRNILISKICSFFIANNLYVVLCGKIFT